MKPFIFVILFCGLSATAFCQNSVISILKQKEEFVPYYEMAAAGSSVLFLPMNFGKSSFSYLQEGAVMRLKHAEIARVDLVYSDFPAKTDITPLTQKRLEALKKILPGVFLDKNIEFRKVRQTIGTTEETAAGLQHGFFIYFRPLPTKTSGKEEVRKLATLLGETSKKTKRDSIGWCSQWTMRVDTSMENMPPLPEGCTRTITKMSLTDAVADKLLGKEYEKEFRAWGDSAYYIEDVRGDGCEMEEYSIYEETDTTVAKVFKRHNWSHSFVIADVTGSMYPYTGQLLKWLKLNLTDKTERYFIFFNDGDDKEDDKKVIGKTGGIYPVVTNVYDSVEETVKRAMTNGSGGDIPENNIEALLESDRICKNCDSIVMIVDNWAPIKDLVLLKDYHKPVKVVVCGVFDKINKDYLKLARDTKGSIHLIEEDIYNLSKLKEGETLTIHGQTYKLVGGEFVDVSPKTL
jgi:hypothetical protein